jgi:fatty acid desaturase
MAGWSVGPYEIVQRQDVRIGTAERERTAALLSQHLSAGRLELDEFDDRVKAAYAARTGRELTALLADLPSPQPRRRRRKLPANRFLLALVVLAAVITFAVVAAFPPILIVPVLFVVLRHRRHRHYRMAPAAPWQP